MSTSTTNPILIVGAGPTGMIMAIELARRGVPCRLIDKKEGPTDTSRSFTLHAKTMEMFEHMGIAHRFLSSGIKSKGFSFNFKGKDERPSLDFTGIDSPFPYILVFNQNDTERELREHLETTYGIVPQWHTALNKISVSDDGSFNLVLYNDLTGNKETLDTPWLVGCDGIHSFVRKSLRLDFEGENYDGMVMQMMDVAHDNFQGSDDWVHYYMSKENFLLITRLPNGNHRVLISEMGETDASDLAPREAFQKLIDGHMEGTQLAEPSWATKWTIWKRLAKQYRAGNAFLCGDAAHVHSPSGGQGMNIGMQDAYNLGWKLALVAKGTGSPELLDSYHVERRPVGDQAILGTDAMHDIIMAHGHGMEDRLALTQEPNWHDDAVSRISGMSYTYQDTYDLPAGLTSLPGPQPGERLPDVKLSDAHRLFDVLRHPQLTLLMIGDKDATNEAIDVARQVAAHNVEAIKPVLVTSQHQEADAGGAIIESVLDTNHSLEAMLATRGQPQTLLVRPDGYIAFRCLLTEQSYLLDYVQRYFTTLSATKAI